MRDAAGDVVESVFVIVAVGVTDNVVRAVVIVPVVASRAGALPSEAADRPIAGASRSAAWRIVCIRGIPLLFWC